PGADPRTPDCPADAALSCKRTGKCDGAGACQTFAPRGTACGARTCDVATETPAPLCDGAGTCILGVPHTCGDYVCKADACATTCTVDTDCVPQAYCRQGTCQMRAANGGVC